MRSIPAPPFSLLVATFAVLASACGGHHHHPRPRPEEPRPVSILVEVYDPATNLVWENVSVRVVEADQEWSGGTWVSPWLDWYLTDANGQVLLDEYLLADAEVGFRLDGAGRALLHPYRDEDQAVVVLEIDAVGFTPVIVEVPLRWDDPDVFVAVPFD
jgi:hypothetical protein